MSSIKVEMAEEHVLFHLYIGRPYGVLDEYRVCKVSRDGYFILSAQEQPSRIPPLRFGNTELYHYSRTEMFWFGGHWVAFNFTSFQENSVGPNWDDYHGPYLVPFREPPPTPREEAESKKKGEPLIRRRKNFFRLPPEEETGWV